MISRVNNFIKLKKLLIEGLRLAFAIICLILILGIIAYFVNQINCANCVFQPKYEGRVIDKSLTFSESQLGSRIIRRLYIKSSNGGEFQVNASESLYNQVKIGDLIKSDEERTEIIDEITP